MNEYQLYLYPPVYRRARIKPASWQSVKTFIVGDSQRITHYGRFTNPAKWSKVASY